MWVIAHGSAFRRAAFRYPAPDIGADNDEVYGRVGYSAGLTELRDHGVI